MAYFKQNRNPDEQEYTRRFDLPEESSPEEETDYDGYDDGFDELTRTEEDDEDAYEDELTDEEKFDQQKRRYRLFMGIGDLAGTVIGAVVILLLIALLVSMINFLRRDMGQNLTMLKTKW